jgi:hypothetical protein
VISSCVDLNETGDLSIVDEVKYEKMLSTFEFMDSFSNDIMQTGGRRSKESNLIPFLSGIRSMICASLLIRATGSKIAFSDIEYDLKYDLDVCAIDRSGRKHAFDITTHKDETGKVIPKLLFSYFKQDFRTKIPKSVIMQEDIYTASKLIVPNVQNHPDFYSKAKGGRTIGIPAPHHVRTFANMFRR